jgi:hypothetical protein
VRRQLITMMSVIGGLVGCASASPPPGGPEDHAPPKLVRVTPDSGAVNVTDRDASFYFDETINDRGSGAQALDGYFLVSPSDGTPRLSYRRSRIDVRPRGGFRPNTAYTVTLLPGLSDLRGNTMRSGESTVFSTGPTIPPERINGIVFDWATERPAARALLQAVTPDSVVYLAQSDSTGRFTIGPLTPGGYLVRAIVDQNGNHALDRNEPYDSARVVVPQTAPLELLAIQRDTLPPRILSVTPLDSASLRVTFDRYLDPAHPPAASAFRLLAPDSSVVPVVSVLTSREEQRELQAAQQAKADSSRRADSLAGKVLSPRPAVDSTIARRTAAAIPKPSVPPPYTSVLLRIARPLVPSTTYRLTVADARGLSGRSTSSERTFTTPKPPPPKSPTDSAKAATPTPPKGR